MKRFCFVKLTHFSEQFLSNVLPSNNIIVIKYIFQIIFQDFKISINMLTLTWQAFLSKNRMTSTDLYDEKKQRIVFLFVALMQNNV